MPEHVHLILLPREIDYDISAILSTVKQSVAKRAILFVNQQAPAFADRMLDRAPNGDPTLRFWQRGGGYDRNLYTPKEIWEKINYVHGNPVERGLADSPGDWLWSSAADYAGIRQGPLPINWDSIPR
ncbi:MAG TPA: hypothetical protein VHP11_06790 [Tepidisphaeraceae bacterium]|nr:hypothetical protein [Tepidisphaeraceae bacterium]